MTPRGDRPASLLLSCLVLGFGTTVAMWTIGYIGRFPLVNAPGWLLLGLLMLCLFIGGYLAGRFTERNWRGGLYTGLLVAVLNLLVLGSLLSGPRPGQIVPSAVWWLPGSLLASAVIAGCGGWLGWRTAGLASRPWLSQQGTGALAAITAAATFLLLVAGGIVTSNEAGLAVVDWPNSYGYNMFLYPLSRMTGGIYYEHVHRLLGSLVGLTTLVLAVHLQWSESRHWVRRFALVALGTVVLQGILGGLRVTGRFTLSTDPLEMAPNLILAIVHGILGQLFFGMAVSLAVFTSRRWRSGDPAVSRPAAAADRTLGICLIAILVIQLVLGAILRHMTGGLLVHITLAVIVILLTVAVGVRSWAHYQDVAILRRLGNALLFLITAQLALGLAALIATGIERSGEPPPPADIVLTTAHQACGALLLTCSVALTLWFFRLVTPET